MTHPHSFALIPENPHRKHRLGRHVHFDERSREHSMEALIDKTKALVTKLWSRKAAILDQGSVGACVGNGSAGALGTAPNCSDGVADKITIDEKLALSIYGRATQIDTIRGSYPPSDTGSTVLAGMKALKAMGLIAGYKWCFTQHAVLQALAHHGPVVVGTDWLAGMDSPDPKTGLVHVIGKNEGGHCYVLDGIDVEKKLVHACNSWSSAWGMGGRFSYSWDDLAKLMKADGEAAFVLPPA